MEVHILLPIQIHKLLLLIVRTLFTSVLRKVPFCLKSVEIAKNCDHGPWCKTEICQRCFQISPGVLLVKSCLNLCRWVSKKIKSIFFTPSLVSFYSNNVFFSIIPTGHIVLNLDILKVIFKLVEKCLFFFPS
jgi:hypothetical protein